MSLAVPDTVQSASVARRTVTGIIADRDGPSLVAVVGSDQEAVWRIGVQWCARPRQESGEKLVDAVEGDIRAERCAAIQR